MKRILMWGMALMMLFSSAFAAAGYNSFFDDKLNAGYYDNKAWDGEYVYWLAAPNDNTWNEYPNNVYRMRPGDEKAEMILEGREDLWVYNIWNIGDKLLLGVHEKAYGNDIKPALIDFDGSNYRELSGRIGSVVLAGDVLYNSVGGHIYEIDLDTMESTKIYSYPEEIAAKNPILYQIADDMLYYSTDTHEIYSLYRYPDADTKSGKVAEGRGSWFVYNGYLYMSDYEKENGTWKYNVYGGANHVQISDKTYAFYQGSGEYIRARRLSNEGGEEPDQGSIIDITKMQSSLEEGIIGSCDHYYDAIFGGNLIRYDWENNIMEAARNIQ